MPTNKALGTVSNRLITSPAFRRSFRSNPIEAARFVAGDDVDLDELDALSSLSEKELDALSDIRKKLEVSHPDLVSDVNGGVAF